MIGVQIVGVRGKVISVALVSAWLTSLRIIDFIRVAGSEAGEQPPLTAAAFLRLSITLF
jgi:hypothetical protein